MQILKIRKIFSIITAFYVLLIFSDAKAQIIPETVSADTKEQPVIIEDSLGRNTPRGLVNGFIKAVGDQNYARASQYLELRPSLRKEKEREKVVRTFQKLLDQGGNIMPYSWISNKITGRVDDDLAANVDLVGNLVAEGESIELFVENREEDGKPPVWRFTLETVNQIAAVAIEQTLLDKILPDYLKAKKMAGVPLGHWLAVIVLVLFAYLLSWAATASLCSLLSRFPKNESSHAAAIINVFHLPARLYLAVWIFILLSKHAGISIIVRQQFSSITVIIAIVAILILLWRMSDFFGTYSQEKFTRRGRISAISIVLFLKRAAKIAILVIGFIAILGTIGIDVTAGIAALGIGGIALALGAQKTVENFVGSVMLIADQPIRVGDYCKVGEVTGTVEQIGMRSTVFRTGERTLVTIPNGDLAASKIENYAYRDRFLFNPVLEFRPETTTGQIRFLLVELRAILYAHPMVNPDPAKVRFTKIGVAARFEIWSYINAPNFDVFQEVQEDILLRMMEVIGKSGTALVLPSQNIYFGRNTESSEEMKVSAEEKVKQWKENGELQLPNFTQEYIESIKGSIVYPENGSAAQKKTE